LKYVYVLESLPNPTRHYVGATLDVVRRLDEHNSGKSIQTNKYRPWRVKVSIAFEEEAQADAFERYLKSGSGRAFIKRHFA
jgi:predicted GIY-YIG superfamily endonuclease